RLGPAAVAAVFGVCLLAVGANVMLLKGAGDYLRNYSRATAADLGAIEIARGQVPPTFAPSSGVLASSLVAGTISAGPYLAAVDRIGSFASSPLELSGEPEPVREEADAVLAEALDLRASPAAGPTAPSSCRRVSGSGFGLHPGDAFLRSPSSAPLRLRR